MVNATALRYGIGLCVDKDSHFNDTREERIEVNLLYSRSEASSIFGSEIQFMEYHYLHRHFNDDAQRSRFPERADKDCWIWRLNIATEDSRWPSCLRGL